MTSSKDVESSGRFLAWRNSPYIISLYFPSPSFSLLYRGCATVGRIADPSLGPHSLLLFLLTLSFSLSPSDGDRNRSQPSSRLPLIDRRLRRSESRVRHRVDRIEFRFSFEVLGEASLTTSKVLARHTVLQREFSASFPNAARKKKKKNHAPHRCPPFGSYVFGVSQLLDSAVIFIVRSRIVGASRGLSYSPNIGTRREEPLALPVDRATDATASTPRKPRGNVPERIWRRDQVAVAWHSYLAKGYARKCVRTQDREGRDTDRTANSDNRGSPWRTDARTMLILPDIKLQVKIIVAWNCHGRLED